MKSTKLFFTLFLLTFLAFSCTPEDEINEEINEIESLRIDPIIPDEIDGGKGGN